MIKPPDYVLDIQPYVPGKPIEELERELGIRDSVKLASNENPLGPSPAAVEAIRNSFHDLHRYPDGSGFYLTGALSRKLGVKPEEIILGNGSNELLDLAVKTYMKDGDEAIMAAPSFVVYAMAVKSVGGRPLQIPLRDYTHDLDAMADAITPATKMVFIANPNNPTGTMNTAEELGRLMARVPQDVLVVVDEAYIEYVMNPAYPDSLGYLRQGRNILILRTFSKIYGLAGLRIGYGIAPAGVVLDMNRLREPFNTNSLAQKAALAALSDTGQVDRSRKTNNEGKKYLCGELDALGIRYVPTEANFIYIPWEGAAELYGKLLKMGVIIRPMGPGAVRVTIGLPEENRKFIESLKAVTGKG